MSIITFPQDSYVQYQYICVHLVTKGNDANQFDHEEPYLSGIKFAKQTFFLTVSFNFIITIIVFALIVLIIA